MRASRWFPALLVVGLLASPALAEEIIYFTNGTTMPIKSHTVVREMIHVDLGVNSYMAFPLYMVEKVTRAGEEVELNRSTVARNRMATSHAVNASMVQTKPTTETTNLSMEEKVRRYTQAARNGELSGSQRNASQPNPGRRSTSADHLTSVDMDSTAHAPPRQQFAGASENLSGRRLGIVRPSQRKTVGGKIIGKRGGVELVGLRREFSAPPTASKNKSGGSADSN
jgi:hypothetical protein